MFCVPCVDMLSFDVFAFFVPIPVTLSCFMSVDVCMLRITPCSLLEGVVVVKDHPFSFAVLFVFAASPIVLRSSSCCACLQSTVSVLVFFVLF